MTPGTTVGATAARIVATNLPQGVTQAMVDAGQDQFGTVCASCHGQGGVGSPAGPALNDATWLNISGQYPEIITIINTGVAEPPGSIRGSCRPGAAAASTTSRWPPSPPTYTR